ncbi:MAG: hypothetical protein ACK4TL_17360 [Hyphomicrobiaceae bacterium]
MAMLVDPTPRTLHEMMAWEEFRDAIRRHPPETLRTRAQAICVMEIEPDMVALRTGILHELETADEEGDLPETLIFVGLKLGLVAAYAYLPTAGSCFQIKRFCWRCFPRAGHEAIESGRTRLPTDGLPPQSIESDLANRALFVPASAVKDLLNLRPPSDAALDRIATLVISAHQAQSAAKMRKRDFIDRIIDLAPGCTRERAERAWAKHAPAAWKRPGRPRRA